MSCFYTATLIATFKLNTTLLFQMEVVRWRIITRATKLKLRSIADWLGLWVATLLH
jgi:hypothetical protein